MRSDHIPGWLRRTVAGLVVSVATVAPIAQAQVHVTVELHGGVAGATSTLAGAHLDPGSVFGATIARKLGPDLQILAGWDWARLHTDQLPGGSDRDVDETGLRAGLRYQHAVPGTGDISYRVEGGPTYRRIEIRSGAGQGTSDSRDGFGYQIGAGMVIPFRDPSWMVTPGVSFSSLRRVFDDGTGAPTTGRLSYAGLSVGIARSF